MQEESMSTSKIVREGTLTSESIRKHQQHEVTMLKKDKNKNRKRNPETQIIRNKARKLSKKKVNLETLQKFPKKNSQKIELQKLNLVGITKPCRMGLLHGEAI
jgi:hypothetical protein